MAIKAICPTSPEHKRFKTTAHVMEEWVVDERGNFIDLIAALETVHGPDMGNTWTCTECGSYAKVERVPR